MYTFYSCGEQDIEDNGIAICFSSLRSPRSKEEAFLGMIDSLLGVSEFVTNCEYDFADVAFDFSSEYLDLEDIKCFNDFIESTEASELRPIYHKYCDCAWGEPTEEDGTVFYGVTLFKNDAKLLQEDIDTFVRMLSVELAKHDLTNKGNK